MRAQKKAETNIETTKKGIAILNVFSLIFTIIRIIARIILVAIFFFVVAKFVPELRDTIPSFYVIVDFILSLFERICGFVSSYIS